MSVCNFVSRSRYVEAEQFLDGNYWPKGVWAVMEGSKWNKVDYAMTPEEVATKYTDRKISRFETFTVDKGTVQVHIGDWVVTDKEDNRWIMSDAAFNYTYIRI